MGRGGIGRRRVPTAAQTMKAEIDALVRKLATARRPWSLRQARHEFERSYVEYVIRCSEGDRNRAAKQLDIGFSTLKEKIRQS